MSLFIMFIILLVLATFISVKYKKEISDTIFLSLCLIMLLLFLIGILGLLKYTVIIISIFTLIIMLYDIYLIIKDKSLIKKYLLKPALLYTVIAFILTFYIYNNAFMTQWDEFSHWGIYVKNMFNHNELYNSSFTSIANGYPPIISLLQYFLMKLSNIFSEEQLYQGLSLLTVLPLTCFLKNFNSKNKVIMAIMFFLLFFFPLTLSSYYITSIYVDVVLGILFASIIISLIFDELSVFNLFKNLITCSVLILAKEFGLILVGIYFAILLVDIFFIRKERYLEFYNRKLKNKKIVTFLLLTIPFILRIIWYFYVKNINVSSQIDATLNLSEKNSFLEVFSNFTSALFTKNIDSMGGLLNIPTFYWIFIFIIILVVTKKFIIDKKDNKIIDLGIISIIVSSILYCGCLFLSYFLLFSNIEASTLASFDRYIVTLLLALYILVIFIIIYLVVHKKIKDSLIPIGVITLFVFTFGINQFLLSFKYPITNNSAKEEYYERFKTFIDATNSVDNNLYFVNCNGDGKEHLIAQYLITPIHINDLSTWNKLCVNDETDTNYTKEEFERILDNYSYVYLFEINDDFITKYTDLFNNKLEISSNKLYNIRREDGSTKLYLEEK